MEYSVSDLIRILLKKWYVIVLVMAILGGAAGVLSQRSYQSALAEYEDYTTRTVPINTEVGELTAVYQCSFKLTDMSRYRQRFADKREFIDTYMAGGGTQMPTDRLYQEAETAFSAANSDFSALFANTAVLAEVQAYAVQQEFLEPVTVGADGTLTDSAAPLAVSGHLSATISDGGVVTVTLTGLPEELGTALLEVYWQAVKKQGAAQYDMQVSAEPLTQVYAPQKPALTEDALLSQTVMQKPEHVPMLLQAVGKGAAFGFLFGCFGILLYTFIRDTAPTEKQRRAVESVR